MEQTKRLGSLQEVCERLDAAVAALDEQIIVHAWDTASASLLCGAGSGRVLAYGTTARRLPRMRRRCRHEKEKGKGQKNSAR